MCHGGPARHGKFFPRRITWTKVSIMGYSFFLLVCSNREGGEPTRRAAGRYGAQHNADAIPEVRPC
jgi:hypothetical protein